MGTCGEPNKRDFAAAEKVERPLVELELLAVNWLAGNPVLCTTLAHRVKEGYPTTDGVD